MSRRVIAFFIILTSACSRGAAPRFDGARAFQLLEAQCQFGPRAPGSEGHRKCREFLTAHLQKTTQHVSVQTFSYLQPRSGQRMSGYNVIARFAPHQKSRVLVCAHWDTRPWADEDPVAKNRTFPVPGANDGASGTAVLLHLAELLAKQPPTVGVDIVLFDAEDSGVHNDNSTWALGSAAFAREFGRAFAPRFGILLDMIGDADLAIYQEAYSLYYAPAVVRKVWDKAAELGIVEFLPQQGSAVYDDHIPLLRVGIPCIDIIDFDYPYWHTLQDTPDKCSPASLEKVGRVVTAVIYEEK
ncbi:MAG: M28 family peptidase [candidate division KSB1 bacterium]|nr:M28 family peptidase [candidate division KSB1 bacterium]MDZ7347082.1 M28 family peptidase [candidate division KSB1 bacterium]